MNKRGMVLVLSVLVVMLSFPVFAQDEDKDGFCISAAEGCPPELDCNDNDPLINPDATEILNGLDDDCNGIVDDIKIQCVDSDLDKYNKTVPENGGTIEICGPNDCDDSAPYVSPAMQENCNNEIDDNCDGLADENDPQCMEPADDDQEDEGPASDCVLESESSAWYDCNSEISTSANEGDSAFLVLVGTECDAESSVSFEIYEYTEGQQPVQVGSALDFTEKSIGLLDSEGNPTLSSAWVATWIASYMEHSEGSDSQYYFIATLREPSGYETSLDLSEDLGKLMAVKRCPEGAPECGNECVFDGSGGFQGGHPYTPYNETNATICNPKIDCTTSPWSSCDSVTNTKTRDVTKCIIDSDDAECVAAVMDAIVSEQACTLAQRPDTSQVEPKSQSECGDGNCDAGEDEESCPEDCAIPAETGGLGWRLYTILAVVAVGGIIGGYLFVKKKKSKAVSAAKPEKKPATPVTPFANQKDLDSVLAYIKTARSRNVKDDQVSALLAKGGWKPEQIKFAFSKSVQSASQTQQPATQPK